MSTPRPLIDKYESGRIRVQLRHAFLEVWNPIGVRDEPNAQNDAYVGGIYELLVSQAPDSKIADHLYWVAHDRMGFEFARPSDMASTVKTLRGIPLWPAE